MPFAGVWRFTEWTLIGRYLGSGNERKRVHGVPRGPTGPIGGQATAEGKLSPHGLSGERGLDRMGPRFRPEIRKTSPKRLQNLRAFTPAAARQRVAVFSLGLAVRSDACLLMSA